MTFWDKVFQTIFGKWYVALPIIVAASILLFLFLVWIRRHIVSAVISAAILFPIALVLYLLKIIYPGHAAALFFGGFFSSPILVLLVKKSVGILLWVSNLIIR